MKRTLNLHRQRLRLIDRKAYWLSLKKISRSREPYTRLNRMPFWMIQRLSVLFVRENTRLTRLKKLRLILKNAKPKD